MGQPSIPLIRGVAHQAFYSHPLLNHIYYGHSLYYTNIKPHSKGILPTKIYRRYTIVNRIKQKWLKFNTLKH